MPHASRLPSRYRSVVAMRKDDGSMVTEADYAAQRALTRKLAALEDIPVLGEEMPSHEQLAISVALMEGSRPVFGTACDAGALILEEARGFHATLDHEDFWAAPVWTRSVIAARTRPLPEEWRAWIRRELARQ